jgi:hypothetical protein
MLLLLALLASAALAARQREGTEWSTAYWYNANEHQLPRVLLIGDSICAGYQDFVHQELAGTAYVSYWASSKCVSDPTYLKALEFMLGESRYAVIHFNNGLHSLDSNRGEWQAGLRAAFALLKDKGQGAKVIWATSTPLKDPALTAKAKELNAIAAKVVAELGLPTDDLFGLMDPQDRAKLWSDTFHYTEPGRRMEAKQVADSIRALLPPAAPVAAAAANGPELVANGGFEGDGGWAIYPPKDDAGGFEFVTADAKVGQRCAKIAVKTAGLQFYQFAPALAAGKTYELSFWAKADQPAKLQVHVRTQKPPYQFYGDQTVDLTTAWQSFSTTLTLPADYDPAAHVLFFELPTAGVYWLDEVRAVAK